MSRANWYLTRELIESVRPATPAQPPLAFSSTTLGRKPVRYTTERITGGCVVFWLGEKVPVRTVAPSIRPLAGPWKPPRPTGITPDCAGLLETDMHRGEDCRF